MTRLTSRFAQALTLAHELHQFQLRKGSQVPYISHLLSVCALALEHGADEDGAIAALLHDAVEDQGGEATLAVIEGRFGARVARMVRALSDSTELPKPPWRARKEAYLAHLGSEPEEVLRISLADKLHNVRTLLADGPWGTRSLSGLRG